MQKQCAGLKQASHRQSSSLHSSAALQAACLFSSSLSCFRCTSHCAASLAFLSSSRSSREVAAMLPGPACSKDSLVASVEVGGRRQGRQQRRPRRAGASLWHAGQSMLDFAPDPSPTRAKGARGQYSFTVLLLHTWTGRARPSQQKRDLSASSESLPQALRLARPSERCLGGRCRTTVISALQRQ